MGNSIMTMDDDAETSTHEMTHYYQQMIQGWARYFGGGYMNSGGWLLLGVNTLMALRGQMNIMQKKINFDIDEKQFFQNHCSSNFS